MEVEKKALRVSKSWQVRLCKYQAKKHGRQPIAVRFGYDVCLESLKICRLCWSLCWI